MNPRLVLRSLDGDVVERDVVDGMWAEPEGVADSTFGADLWALPGLVDAHAHIAADSVFEVGDVAAAQERLRGALRSGVTLVIDKGWDDETSINAAREMDPTERPEFEGAEQMVSVDGGYYQNFGLAIDPSDIGAVVKAKAAAGEGWVKLVGDWPRKGVGPVANFTEDQLRTAVQVAEASGSRVAIHTMARDVPSIAVAAGVHSIEHGLFLTRDDLDPLADRAGMWVPTVLRMEEVIEQIGAESTGGKLIREGLDNVASLLPLAVEAGVHVLAGTDLVGAPGDVAAEALRLAGMGLSNHEAIGAASTAAFDATGRSSSYQPGSPANAVFLEANPVLDLGVLEHPTAIVRLGQMT